MWSAGTTWIVITVVVAGSVVGLLSLSLRRAHRAHDAAIEERGWLLEREREGAASAAVAAERSRIARELHDIVSHNVSVMVIQAAAAREVLTSSPGEASAALTAVESAGRQTMTELRHLLGLLAPSPDGSDDSDLAPQPSLRRLSPLIDRIAFAGLPVEVRIAGEPRPLRAGVDLTAYRIVQEALTNALKYGDQANAVVSIRYADRYLRIEVVNSGPSVLAGDRPQLAASEPDGAGYGLAGLRERVRIFGGELDARRRLGGGYRVRARIPVDPL